jgi:xanthine/CO dehydrogenase XdhC/CoxF family maturation factor
MRGLQAILQAQGSLREPAALATLVRAKGSSYRQAGARMVLQAGGVQTGVISAGCMETDVKERVGAVLAGGRPQLASFDMGNDLDLIWGTGMGCQGRAEILLETLAPGAPAPWLALCAAMLEGRRRGAMATVFAVRGSDPGACVGERFLLDSGGPGLPPPEGPFAEGLRAILERTLALGAPSTETLVHGAAELDLLLEPILPPYALWLFGASEHVRPLAKLARNLDWFLGLVDHRPALATPERFPEADRIVLGRPPECLDGLILDGRSAALVVSHVYEIDKLAMAALLERPLGYLGLQGNRTRSARIMKELREEGLVLDPTRERTLHIPAGLDLGAESPEVIALSMLAEVQAALSGHAGGCLRDRSGSIHQPVQPLPTP